MKKSPILGIIAIALAAVSSCSVFAQPLELSERDYAVLSDFLRAQLSGKNGIDDLRVGANGSIISSVTTVFLEPIDREQRKQILKMGVASETIESFEGCAGRQMKVDHNFNLPLKYEVALPGETKDIKMLYEHHPHTHGYLGFTCVGVNRSGSQALFSVERLMTHSAVGKWIVMEKDPSGNWVVKGELVTWIA